LRHTHGQEGVEELKKLVRDLIGKAYSRKTVSNTQIEIPDFDSTICQSFIQSGGSIDDAAAEDMLYYFFDTSQLCGVPIEYDELDIDEVGIILFFLYFIFLFFFLFFITIIII